MNYRQYFLQNTNPISATMKQSSRKEQGKQLCNASVVSISHNRLSKGSISGGAAPQPGVTYVAYL